ncbi:MAG TPA: hypothetical protein VL524_10885 [Gemmatimonadaceae bacterium]|jgi:hypothetical protein|nr:hypothetical protein [Gemmatimonadaceae bacterium]
MTDDRFEELLRDAARTYRNPPDSLPERDAMWAAIERRTWGPGQIFRRTRPTLHRVPAWLGIAATLIIGISIGRASSMLGRHQAPPQHVASVAAAKTVRTDSAVAMPYETETSQYLGQTAALLIALPSAMKGDGADDRLIARAAELLTRTRLLIDSPAARDPEMRGLLEDLELVLAQVVRLQENHSRTELDLINRALEQRDVIPRLRIAVADISAN